MILTNKNLYLKATDVVQGELITFTDAGCIEVSDKFRYQNQDGTQGDFQRSLVFKCKYKNEDKKIKIGAASKISLIEAFGEDTDAWVGKSASIMVIPTPNGKHKQIIIIPIKKGEVKKVNNPSDVEWGE